MYECICAKLGKNGMRIVTRVGSDGAVRWDIDLLDQFPAFFLEIHEA